MREPLAGPGEYEALLRQMAGLAPLAFIMGGFAEDGLLGHGLGRPHKDLDLLTRRGDLSQLLEELDRAGLGPFEIVLADPTGRPLMLSGRWAGLELEIYVAGPEPGGEFGIEVPAQGAAGRLRLFLPADTFQYPATAFEGISIQTVSPLALALQRAASAQTRHQGDKQSGDLAVLAHLRRAFLAGYDARQLVPRIEQATGN